MRLWRALPLDRRAGDDEPGGALYFPRLWQGAGRHDNPDLYGCLYLAEEPVSVLAEVLAPFRGTGTLLPSMLVRFGTPLALAALELEDGLTAVDLDEPATLLATRLHPSQVATRHRSRTQEQAAALFEAHRDAVGLRWWSTLESSWIDWTLFDRAAPQLSLAEARPLTIGDTAVREAAELLGLAV